MVNRIKYIDLCRGEIRVGFDGDRITSLCGGPSDCNLRRQVAIEALRSRIDDLRERIKEANSVLVALDQWDGERGK